MALSDEMATAALTLLTKFGQAISVVRNTNTYDPATGDVTGESTTSYSGVGYPSNYVKRYVDGSTVAQGDILLIFASDSGEDPRQGDVFTVGSIVYTAQNVQQVSVQGVNVVYKIELRQ